ncbi:MAG: hypothetical protein WC791_02135 [Candidatus Paceibacterota bacterium]|jgi:hypothetical protein
MNATTIVDENETIRFDFRILLEQMSSEGMTAGKFRTLLGEFEQKHAPEVHAKKMRLNKLESEVHNLFLRAITPVKNLKKLKELLSLLKEAKN